MTERERILARTTAERDKAAALLRELLDARAASERLGAETKTPDLMKQVTGKSALDNAIASTQRMIESFNRTIDQFRRELTDEDLALIEEPKG